MFWLKRRPRCSGDLFEQNDKYGIFVTCMGYVFSKYVHDKLVDPDNVNVNSVPAPVVPIYEAGNRLRLSNGGRHFDRTLSWVNDSDFGSAALPSNSRPRSKFGHSPQLVMPAPTPLTSVLFSV